MKVNFSLNNISEPQIRDTFSKFKETLETDTILKGTWKFYDVTTKNAGTVRLNHRLNFIPTDIIVTASSGATVTFDYESFDRNVIVFTTSGASRIRFFAGKAD